MLYRKNLFIAALTFTVFLTAMFANAQKIIVMLKQPPPNQWHVQDLWQLTLTNTSQESYNVYLYGTVEEAGAGMIFEGTSATFELPPNFSGPVNPGDLEPVDVEYTNDDYEEIVMKTGTLPAGTYTICVYVKNYETEEELGHDCIIQTILHPSPPELISPQDGAIVEDEYPVFMWMPPIPIPPGQIINYAIKIVEILDGQTAIEAMEANPALFKTYGRNKGSGGTDVTSYQFPISAREFKQGVTYAWQITAWDDTEDWMIGKSEVWWFKYSPEIIPFKLKLLTPGLAEEIGDPYPLFSWSISENIENYHDINYTLKIFEVDTSSKPIDYSVEKPDVMIETQNTFYQYSGNDMALREGKAYVWWVEAEIGIYIIVADTAHIFLWDFPLYDYGDAPAPYPTSKINNGAKHLWRDIITTITINRSKRAWLGAFPSPYDPNNPTIPENLCGLSKVDVESDANTADNYDDGIYFFPTPINYCDTCILDSIDVMVNTDPLYNKKNNLIFHAWFDWNDNGNWDDSDTCDPNTIVYDHIHWVNAKIIWPTWAGSPSFMITGPEITFFPAAWSNDNCAIYRLYFYTAPSPASNIWTRFRLTPDILVNHSASYNHYNVYTDKVVSGEVEDYLIECEQLPDSCDYGDAPDELDNPKYHYCSHNLCWTHSAAKHCDFSNEWLGNINAPDSCYCPGPTADAEADGLTIDLDLFDNGVIFTAINFNTCDTQTVEVLINTSGIPLRYQNDCLHLHAWFDWNRDGDWDDTHQCQGTPADDHIYWLTAEPLCMPGMPDEILTINNYDFKICDLIWIVEGRPCEIYKLTFLAGDTSLAAGANEHVSDTLWCRFRLSYDGAGGTVANNYHGGVKFGEVEDYPLLITPTPPTSACDCECDPPLTSGPDLVFNGDFSAGAVGFTSGYTLYAHPGNILEGEYSVGNSAGMVHSDWLETGMGTSKNFLMCNGSTTAGTSAWTQTFAVSPDSTYKFCAYVNNLINPALPPLSYGINPQIQLRVNGIPLSLKVDGISSSTLANIPVIPNQWRQIAGTWKAPGGITSANLEILSKSTWPLGNDFGIDCIEFIECILLHCDCNITEVSVDGKTVNNGETINISTITTSEEGMVVYSPSLPSRVFKVEGDCGEYCPATYDWTIKKPDGLYVYSNKSTFTYTFMENGKYTFIININCEVDGTSCTHEFYIEVDLGGDAGGMEVDDSIIPDTTITY